MQKHTPNTPTPTPLPRQRRPSAAPRRSTRSNKRPLIVQMFTFAAYLVESRKFLLGRPPLNKPPQSSPHPHALPHPRPNTAPLECAVLLKRLPEAERPITLTPGECQEKTAENLPDRPIKYSQPQRFLSNFFPPNTFLTQAARWSSG